MTTYSSRSVVSRAIGAAMLSVDTYEEVEADTSATSQAAMVVAAVAVASAIGASGSGSGGIVGAVLSAFLSWLVWAGVTNLVGTRLLGGTADWGELLRTLGFAQAPGVFLVLGVIPLMGSLLGMAVWLWMLLTGLVAIRQALDFGTGKALITAVVSIVLVIMVSTVIGTVLASIATASATTGS